MISMNYKERAVTEGAVLSTIVTGGWWFFAPSASPWFLLLLWIVGCAFGFKAALEWSALEKAADPDRK